MRLKQLAKSFAIAARDWEQLAEESQKLALAASTVPIRITCHVSVEACRTRQMINLAMADLSMSLSEEMDALRRSVAVEDPDDESDAECAADCECKR